MSSEDLVGKSPAEVRIQLGDEFSLDFVERVQERLGIDVLVLDLQGDAYCLEVAGRLVLVLKRTLHWFRQNFSIAHELGHVAQGSLHGISNSQARHGEQEANAFAAELLMPADALRSMSWDAMTDTLFADLLWRLGVSTEALRIRVEALGISVPEKVQGWLQEGTYHFLRRNLSVGKSAENAIASRQQYASLRYIPADLFANVESAVRYGRAPVASLAWLLNVPESEVLVEDLAVAPSFAEQLDDLL